MSATNSPKPIPNPSPDEAVRSLRKEAAAAASTAPKKESLRDTIESVVFALILALVFRTFEAEAFVIPTGSMAPTLYGRHKEADCEKCGSHILVGASDELDTNTGLLYYNTRLQSALCPNCRFNNTNLKDALAFNGDRILVNKFPYELGEPSRWDVFVFKYPEKPTMNYIKRLVGLPGETIRIRQGDLYKWDGEQETILRKPDPAKQRVLQMTVYDDNHPPRELLASGWPERWIAAKDEGNGQWPAALDTWKHDAEGRVFALREPQGDGLNWLRYRHIVSTPADWADLEAGRPLSPKPQLVSDFCPYNACQGTGKMELNRVEQIDQGCFWVGDLTLNAKVEISGAKPDGELVLELCEGVYLYRCRIQLSDGKARLFEINQALGQNERLAAEADSPVKGDGTYRISFANVDDRVALWVNDTLVDFGDGASFHRDGGTGNTFPQQTDLAPAGIAAKGVGLAVVKDLTLQRDLYYRATGPGSEQLQDNLADLLTDPAAWANVYRGRQEGDRMEIKVDGDGFLAFGDNSPRSLDSRLWHSTQSVARDLLVGKAFFIYWPHGIPFMNEGRGFPVVPHRQLQDVRDGDRIAHEVQNVEGYPKYTLPFYPQFDRMKRIR